MSASFHLKKSQHDKITNEYLQQRTPTFRDWEVITLFYSALHLIETYFINHGIPIPKHHQAREDLVEQYPNDIFEAYLELYTVCKTARYDAFIGEDDLINANDYYIQIKNFIEPVL